MCVVLKVCCAKRSEYVSLFPLLWIQSCAILYDVMMMMVRMMMIMMVMTKCGKNVGSLKNKTHFLNWSQGSTERQSIRSVTLSCFVC